MQKFEVGDEVVILAPCDDAGYPEYEGKHGVVKYIEVMDDIGGSADDPCYFVRVDGMRWSPAHPEYDVDLMFWGEELRHA